MITLLALLLRFALLAVFTFAFVVLYEHGPSQYAEGAKAEWKVFSSFVRAQTSPKDIAFGPSATPTPPGSTTPTATPGAPSTPPTPAPPPVTPPVSPAPQQPSKWETMQKKPIGDGIKTPIGNDFEL